MNENILALDLSTTNVGFSFYDCYSEKATCLQFGSFKPDNKDYFERLVEIINWFGNLFGYRDIECVAIEDYAYSRHSSSVTKLAELQGIIKYELYHRGFRQEPSSFRRLYMVPPTSWKKFCFGNGALRKDQVMVKTLSKYDMEIVDDNQADAFCIGKFAWALRKFERSKVLPIYEYSTMALKSYLGVK